MTNVSDLFAIYRHPTGRRLHALRQIARIALAQSVASVSQHAARAIAHDTQVAAMEADYENAGGSENARHGPGATQLNDDVDRGLGGVDAYLEAQQRLFGPDHERGQAATVMRTGLLPNGPGIITKLPYVQQNERIKTLIQQARSDELIPAMATLPEFPGLIDRLDELNEAHGKTLTLEAQARLTRQSLATLQARGQEYLVEVMALIIAHFATTEGTSLDDRDAMLAPIMAQNEVIRQARRRRRAPVDINPGGDPSVEPGDDLPGADVPGDDPPGTDPLVATQPEDNEGPDSPASTQPGIGTDVAPPLATQPGDASGTNRPIVA